MRSAVRVELNGNWYLLLSLRQPFGGSPCPSEFAVVADIVTDTINDLLEDEEWDYKNIYSKAADDIPKCKPLPDEIPFHQARDISVKIHVAPKGKADVYVDDIITIAADIKDNLERITKAPVHDNLVADSLSRDNYFLNANTHKFFLHKSVPQKLPKNFHTKPLPKEISSYITSILQQLPENQQQSSHPKPSELARGSIGILTSIASEFGTYISMNSRDIKETQSYRDSHKRFKSAPSLKEIEQTWWREQSQPSSHMWHRLSGQTVGTIQDWTWMARLALCSKNSTKDIETQMDPRRNKKHSLCQQ